MAREHGEPITHDVPATVLGLGAFWLGLRVQDGVAQETFDRAVLGVWLVIRSEAWRSGN